MSTPNFTGKTAGETRKHIYVKPFGYPIRLCNWNIPEHDFVDVGNTPMCSHCQSVKSGERHSFMKVDLATKPKDDKRGNR
ncbi:hypothetical protein LCGC14_0767810 [marine sediment metagenome]|uniref:Uncharacterized protein n=1 Tax=marine sediment metagenome TaxID=412755 RepID=A0A0F9SJA1_9ZZZZ